MLRLKGFHIFSIVFILTISLCTPSAWSMRLFEKDAGSRVELNIGDTLEVVLDGNPTTGYLWGIASGDTSIIKQIGKPVFKPYTNALGSGGKVTLRFESIGSGQALLRLIYHRPFEKDIPPVKSFEVTVIVK